MDEVVCKTVYLAGKESRSTDANYMENSAKSRKD
jgi:hypothetical protein